MGHKPVPYFACGQQVHLPDWFLHSPRPREQRENFTFLDMSNGDNRPGFFLALFQDEGYALIEAWDTRLNHGYRFEDFEQSVWDRNLQLNRTGLKNNEGTIYITQSGHRLNLVIWSDSFWFGAQVLKADYGSMNPVDRLGDAGNRTNLFLNGTILNGPRESVVTISNPLAQSKLTLDMSDV